MVWIRIAFECLTFFVVILAILWQFSYNTKPSTLELDSVSTRNIGRNGGCNFVSLSKGTGKLSTSDHAPYVQLIIDKVLEHSKQPHSVLIIDSKDFETPCIGHALDENWEFKQLSCKQINVHLFADFKYKPLDSIMRDALRSNGINPVDAVCGSKMCSCPILSFGEQNSLSEDAWPDSNFVVLTLDYEHRVYGLILSKSRTREIPYATREMDGIVVHPFGSTFDKAINTTKFQVLDFLRSGSANAKKHLKSTESLYNHIGEVFSRVNMYTLTSSPINIFVGQLIKRTTDFCIYLKGYNNGDTVVYNRVTFCCSYTAQRFVFDFVKKLHYSEKVPSEFDMETLFQDAWNQQSSFERYNEALEGKKIVDSDFHSETAVQWLVSLELNGVEGLMRNMTSIDFMPTIEVDKESPYFLCNPRTETQTDSTQQ